jgi:hypothetical protein
MTNTPNQPTDPRPASWYADQRAAVAWGVANGLVTRPTADDTDPSENATPAPTSARRDPFQHMRRTKKGIF